MGDPGIDRRLPLAGDDGTAAIQRIEALMGAG